MLTSYDGTAITYDAIGNPVTYPGDFGGYEIYWSEGRKLWWISGANIEYGYSYNADGLRDYKENWNIGEYTEYYYSGTNLVSEVRGNPTDGRTGSIEYLYDDSGMYGFYYNNGTTETVYYYVKNLQGDVVEILNQNLTCVAKYAYDAWGNILYIKDGTGNTVTSPTHIGNINPIRYRGYYYDRETGFYYLQSRYYDPSVGRFINADGYASTGTGFVGYNMFAYCANNPVMYIDSSGEFADFIVGFVTDIVDVVVDCVNVVYEAVVNTPISSNEYLNESQIEHNANIVYNDLSDRGWSHNAICATLGNMQHESTINPGKYQNGVGPGYGLVQWDPARKYLNWALENGCAADSMKDQLTYLIYSMQPGNGEWFHNPTVQGYYLESKDFIKSSMSVEYLTLVFLYSYERASKLAIDERIRYATYWDQYFG